MSIPARTLPLVPVDQRTGLIASAWYDWLGTLDDHGARIAALEALNAGSRLAALEAINAASRLTALETGPGVLPWTPVDTSGAGLTFTVNNATYSKYGRIGVGSMYITYPITANGSNAAIGGFPYSVASGGSFTSFAIFTNAAGGGCVAQSSGTSFNVMTAGPGTAITNAQLSGSFVICGFSFPTNS